MRSSNKRSRSKSNRPKPMGNIVNRVFDSSGPEGKVRGTPQQIIDKYLVLARDAQLSGDRVAAENFLQHAEHYTRMLSEAQRELARETESRRDQYQQGQGPQGNRRHDMRDEADGDNGEAEPDQGERAERQQERQPERQYDRQQERQPERGNRRQNRRDDQRPRRDSTEGRESTDPRGPADASHEVESTLVETPEQRREEAPSAPRQAAPAEMLQPDTAMPSDTPASTPSEPEQASEARPEPKPRKPRAPARRAPRKPKDEAGGGDAPAGEPNAAE